MTKNSSDPFYREPLAYLIFGVLTTVVNYILYFAMTRGFQIHYLPSTVVSWVGAVLFAYVTNRRWVFSQKAHSAKGMRTELVKFVGGRFLSLLLESLIMVLGMEVLHLEKYDWVVKTFAQVFVVIFNYILSKFYIFRAESTDE